jgi:hypothetical protein
MLQSDFKGTSALCDLQFEKGLRIGKALEHMPTEFTDPAGDSFTTCQGAAPKDSASQKLQARFDAGAMRQL